MCRLSGELRQQIHLLTLSVRLNFLQLNVYCLDSVVPQIAQNQQT